jgi:hypothetical protein
MIRLAILVALVGMAIPMTVCAKAFPRTEVPIREVVLGRGVHRYAIPITIGGTSVEAALDTGSTGLRVLPRALPPAALKAGGPPVGISYNGGTRFAGRAIDQSFGIGTGPERAVTIQRIDTVDCREGVPQCEASHATGDQYGIQGEGVAGEGFAAILGIGLKASSVPNPLRSMGVTRWIVELPTEQGSPGRLVLNPDDAEIAGYQRVRMADAEGNQVEGCLAFRLPEQPICGLAEIDTGAPTLRVVSNTPHEPVPPGTSATIAIGDPASGPRAEIVVGQRQRATRLRFEAQPGARKPRLFLGVAPYRVWSVLYDIEAREIGFKPRQGR